MPRPLSDRFKRLLIQPHSDLILIKLITINHPILENPIYLCDAATDFTSNDILYIAVRFSISLPTDNSDKPPSMEADISNVTQDIMDALRTLTSPPTITLEGVYDRYPNDIEFTCPDFELRNCKGDVMSISGTLTVEDYTTKEFGGNFTLSQFRGLVQ